MKNASPLLTEVAEIQLSYSTKVKASQMPRVEKSADVKSLFMDHWDSGKIELQEEFKVMLLNRGNKVMGIVSISMGGIGGTIADPKLIFATALISGASAIVLAHNHPSGTLKPSQADINLTKKIKSAGEFLDITVLDHLILTAEGYYSFADEGAM